MQEVHSKAPADWATGHLLGESYPSAEMQAVYSTAPADWVRHYNSYCDYNHNQDGDSSLTISVINDHKSQKFLKNQ